MKWNSLPSPTSLSTHSSPVHQFDQLHRDAKSQTGAAVATRGRTVGLAECLKDLLLFFGRNPDAGVTDHEVQIDLRFFERIDRDDDDDFALLGELERVADQVDDDLSESPGIADERVGHIRGYEVGQFHSLFRGPQPEGVHGVAQAVAQRKIDRLQFQFSGFHLGEVEDVVEQPQQRVGRLHDDVQILALLIA